MVLRPLTPVLAISDRDDLWPLFHFWCHKLWPKLQLYINLVLSFAGGKDLSIDNQIRVAGSIEPNITSIEPDAKTFLIVSIQTAERTACKQIRNGKTSRSKWIGWISEWMQTFCEWLSQTAIQWLSCNLIGCILYDVV